MPFKLPNAVQETTTTAGTGTLTLAGAVPNRLAFSSQMSNADTTLYVIEDGTDLEAGYGTFISPNQLSRDVVIYSTQGNTLVNWPGSGTRNVFAGLAGEELESLINPAHAAGVLVKTADRTYATRSIAVDTDDLQIANPAGTAGNPTLALAFPVTPFAKTLLDDASAAAMRSTLGLGTIAVLDADDLGVQFRGGVNNHSATSFYNCETFHLGSSGIPQVYSLVAQSGTFTEIYALPITTNTSTIDVNLTLYKNLFPTNMTVTIPAQSGALVSNTTESVSYVLGDYFSLQVTGTGNSQQYISLSWVIK